MLTGFFVAARILANPVSNAFQKQLTRQQADPLWIIGITHAILAFALAPLLLGPAQTPVDPWFWANMGLCVLLAVAGNVLLVHALRTMDLSVLGPINAYKALISLVLGAWILGEYPTAVGVAGVILILAGSSLIVDRVPGASHGVALARLFRERGVQLRLAALALSATEAVFLKKALLLSSPLTTLVWWSILGVPLAGLAVAAVLGRQSAAELPRLRTHAAAYLGLALTTGIMQGTTLATFGRLEVGYSLALFQLSSLVSVFLGHRFFQEPHLQKRLLGSMVMAAGAALIVSTRQARA